MGNQWYALAVQPRKETYVENQLKHENFNVVNVQFLKVVRHARQTKTVRAPLFPGYLFVELPKNGLGWRKANWLPGSLGFIKVENRPSPLEQRFVDQFICSTELSGLVSFKQELKVGDRVRAVGGPCDSLHGEIVAMSAGDRVQILMEAISRKIAVTIPKRNLIAAA